MGTDIPHLARAATMLAFMAAAALVTTAALLVFGPPVKESRVYIGVLVLIPSATAGLLAGGMLLLERRGYRMGFLRGALVGLISMAVFSSTMATLGCHAGDWLQCLVKSLALFGFVMGVPVVVVSALVGMLLDEIFAS